LNNQLPRYLLITILLFIFSFQLARGNNSIFTISAEIEKTVIIGADKKAVTDYIKNVDNYPKDFPDVISVQHTGSNIELLYQVESPLTSPFEITFILTQRSNNADDIILESVNPEPDYFFSRSTFKDLGSSRTSVNVNLKVLIKREKASDINIIAGILGEDFISSRMRYKLKSSLETFLSNVSDELSMRN
jgi:hypothetical protein